MSARLRGIARETEDVVAAGRYRTADGREVPIGRALSAALSGTRLYGPEPVDVAVLDTDRTPVFEVTGESSLRAARRMTAASPGAVAVLTYASARNPGGGYLNGAQAQEEALCRGSALYATLLRAPEYYARHRAERSALYSDRVIHSPGVPVFRDDRGRFLDAPFTAGFLTSPAPNAGVVRAREPERAHLVPAALASRAERVLEVAAACGYRRLVLGAWGCGVFRNDPAEVAGAFHTLLAGRGRFAGHFEQVVFGILERGPRFPVRDAFTRVFAAQFQP
ncbi:MULTISPECIES: TIGR02452 family protein [Streptomyces]|uniref:TIGR02452 family protein n=1 Tax=Streptomyces TaxID=1883 RepID=UPI00081B6A94|nr:MULTISPECIES: TIGR02452 family protein [unclassified Streptomyces]MYQ55214.1 TIGR02452 family protein [Streptomyces sp. SID4941]SCE34461.1 TIGR02452 family protein [Streptomyces sp. PalvLS-984]SDD18916.1 TIGR02452 family protein [Streptomyces sp. AmelKG-A3]